MATSDAAWRDLAGSGGVSVQSPMTCFHLMLAAVELVGLVHPVDGRLDHVVGLLLGRGETLGGEDGVDLLVGLALEVGELDLGAGDARVGGATVVAAELRRARRCAGEQVGLPVALAVAGVAGCGLGSATAAGARGATASPPPAPTAALHRLAAPGTPTDAAPPRSASSAVAVDVDCRSSDR